ncbi:MAG: hypothetical protein HXS41_01740 [Theionarchaea archaeon]|nr:hypothetical protein [Theionarchaea archaeon]MBU7001998.1 hypothetical protein [Theionarchaea archaeon]MBU7019751.1 hypothetical protein [Theionarchaea archaeon]MBU7034629.1 hypothetical protein [Theionarchaea archaeon]MBU7040614.1 hypothetical protein [Theionarchaea archaeon]
MALVITLAMLILVILVVVAIYYLAKAIVYLAANTIVGLIILAVLKWLGLLSGLNIGLWDVILTAIGGVVGVFIIILLYFLGYDI